MEQINFTWYRQRAVYRVWCFGKSPRWDIYCLSEPKFFWIVKSIFSVLYLNIIQLPSSAIYLIFSLLQPFSHFPPAYYILQTGDAITTGALGAHKAGRWLSHLSARRKINKNAKKITIPSLRITDNISNPS